MQMKKRINEDVRTLKQNGNKVTATSILKKSPEPASVSTIQRQLKRKGYKYKVMEKKIELDENKCQARLNTIEDWLKISINFKKVVFVIRNLFTLDGPNNHKTWTLKDEKSFRIRWQAGFGGALVFEFCTFEGKIIWKMWECEINLE